VRVQRVVLEHHRYVALLGREVVDDLAIDADLALGDVLETGDTLKRRRLSTTRRADQYQELSFSEFDVQVVDGDDVSSGGLPIYFGEIVQYEVGH